MTYSRRIRQATGYVNTAVGAYNAAKGIYNAARGYFKRKPKRGRRKPIRINTGLSVVQRVYGQYVIENVAGVLYNTSTSNVASFANLNFDKDQTGSNQFISFGIAFQLTDIPGYARFTALFERYRLRKVRLHIYPGWSNVPSLPNNNVLGQGNGITMCTYDYDDNVAEDSVVDMMQREHMRVSDSIKTISYSLIPRCTSVLQESGGALKAAANQVSPWIDCGEADMVHYGFKWAYQFPQDPLATDNKFTVKIMAEYFLEFKDLNYDN